MSFGHFPAEGRPLPPSHCECCGSPCTRRCRLHGTRNHPPNEMIGMVAPRITRPNLDPFILILLFLGLRFLLDNPAVSRLACDHFGFFSLHHLLYRQSQPPRIAVQYQNLEFWLLNENERPRWPPTWSTGAWETVRDPIQHVCHRLRQASPSAAGPQAHPSRKAEMAGADYGRTESLVGPRAARPFSKEVIPGIPW